MCPAVIVGKGSAIKRHVRLIQKQKPSFDSIDFIPRLDRIRECCVIVRIDREVMFMMKPVGQDRLRERLTGSHVAGKAYEHGPKAQWIPALSGLIQYGQ